MITSGERKVNELARDLGGAWRKQAEGQADLKNDDVFPGNGTLSSKDEEIRVLRRELEEVQQERDFLKKGSSSIGLQVGRRRMDTGPAVGQNGVV